MPTCFVCLVVCLVLLSCGCRKQEPKPEPIKPPAGEAWIDPEQARTKLIIEVVEDQTVQETVLAAGRIMFDETRVSHVYSPVDGHVLSIPGTLGKRVKKGEPLLVLESPDLSTASADLQKAQADLTAAEHDYNRKKKLAEVHGVSDAEMEMAEDNYRKAQAEVKRSKMKFGLFRSGSFDAVSQTYAMRAPIDGEIVMRSATPGMQLQGLYGGGTPMELFTIGDMDRVWVMADVFEMDIARVKLGTRVVVEVLAYPGKKFEGKADWVSGTLDPSSRSLKVRCPLDNPSRELKPDMYATVRLWAESLHVPSVRRSAVVRIGDQTFVFSKAGVAPDGRIKFERLPIPATASDEGDKDADAWVATPSIKAGTEVVSKGAMSLVPLL